jgi:hypothetical protein
MEWTQPFDPASSGSEASPRSWSLSGAATPSPPSSSSSSSSSAHRHGSGSTTCNDDEAEAEEQQQQQGGQQQEEEEEEQQEEEEEQQEEKEEEEDQPLLWAIELVLDRVGAASKWSAPTLPWATIQALRQLAPSGTSTPPPPRPSSPAPPSRLCPPTPRGPCLTVTRAPWCGRVVCVSCVCRACGRTCAVVTRSAGDRLLDRLNVLGLLNWVLCSAVMPRPLYSMAHDTTNDTRHTRPARTHE